LATVKPEAGTVSATVPVTKAALTVEQAVLVTKVYDH